MKADIENYLSSMSEERFFCWKGQVAMAAVGRLCDIKSWLVWSRLGGCTVWEVGSSLFFSVLSVYVSLSMCKCISSWIFCICKVMWSNLCTPKIFLCVHHMCSHIECTVIMMFKQQVEMVSPLQSRQWRTRTEPRLQLSVLGEEQNKTSCQIPPMERMKESGGLCVNSQKVFGRSSELFGDSINWMALTDRYIR